MNYTAIYNDLICNRQTLGSPEGYSERHHIIPRSFGGGDEPTNIVRLTAREHFIAHRLLARIYPTTGMVHAVYKMSCANKFYKRYRVTSRVYEQLRVAHAARVSSDEVAKRKKSEASKGKKQTAEHVRARTDSRKQNGKDWHADTTRQKISAANTGREGPWKGKNIPQEVVERRKQTMREGGGWNWSEERRLAQSIRLTGKPTNKRPLTDDERAKLRDEKSRLVTCPHCGKEGAMMVMPRWHFDNCKKKGANVEPT